ncbi:MAG: GNAT family N-acetyltransferase [Steroidobacteraceae bacterium]
MLDRPDAVDQIAKWLHDEWSVFSGRTYLETHARFNEGIVKGQLPISLVASLADDRKVAGVASLRATDSVDWLPGATPWICNVYVPERARGLGIATSLCIDLHARALELGHGTVHLATSAVDSLYHRLGYRQIARQTHGGTPYFILALDLEAGAQLDSSAR